jgi:hypothetical protein
MLLSTLLAADAAEPVARGIVCDIPDFSVPKGILSASFVARGRDGALDEDVLDVVIAYKTAGVDVALELGPDLDVPVQRVMAVATPLGVGLVLLPGDDMEAYLARVRDYAGALVRNPGFSRHIHPVSECFQAAILRRMGVAREPFDMEGPGQDLLAPAFAAGTEALERAVMEGLEEALGGPGDLDRYIDLHVAGVYENAGHQVADFVSARRAGP